MNIEERVKQYTKERDAAALSFDLEKIKRFAKKWKLQRPADDLVLYAGTMKAIQDINAATPADKDRAAKWLTEHGFSVDWKE